MHRLAIITTVLSAHMWGASIANVWLLVMPGKGATVLTAAAVAAAAVSAVLWTGDHVLNRLLDKLLDPASADELYLCIISQLASRGAAAGVPPRPARDNDRRHLRVIAGPGA